MLSIWFQTLDNSSKTFASCFVFASNLPESCIIHKHVSRFTKVLVVGSSKRPNIVVAALDFPDHLVSPISFNRFIFSCPSCFPTTSIHTTILLYDAFTKVAKFWSKLKKETVGTQHFVVSVITKFKTWA